MKANKSIIFVSAIIALTFGIGLGYFLGYDHGWEKALKDTSTTIATSFEECVSAGNAVMESYPRQCRHGGQTFVEDIGNELEKNDLIRLLSPRPNQKITSPLVITGTARGYWFFEATFPITLTDWDGKIIAQHYAEAQDEWMSEDFVPFRAVLEFENPSWDAEFSKRGTLILHKSNASGFPEHDDALEFTVYFE